MKDDLEARERGVKRPREEDEEEKLEREIRRLAEDGKRRRKEREEALKRDVQREAEAMEKGAQTPTSGSNADTNGNGVHAAHSSGVSELDRTVKVRWPVDGEGGSITTDHVKSTFSTFGPIESADLLSPKMLRLGKKQKKRLAVVCMIQYKSVVGAHAAVEDFPRQEGQEWKAFDSVFWAANKEPDFMSTHPQSATPATPSTPNRPAQHFSDSINSAKFSTPAASPLMNGDEVKKKPSFASFSPAAASTPRGSPFGKGLGVNSPSLEEMTMIRLKNAEKRRLAAEIAKQDAEEDAAAEAGKASG